MKKFFRTFILCLMAICCSFVFVACGEKPTEPEKQQKANVTKEQTVTALEATSENFTANGSVTINLGTLAPLIQAMTGITFNDSGVATIDGFQIKHAGDNYYLSADIEGLFKGEIYLVDGVVYKRMFNADEQAWEADSEALSFDLSALDLATIGELAPIFEALGVSVQTSATQTSYQVKFDAKELIKTVQKVAGVVLTDMMDEEATIESLVNDLLAEFELKIEVEQEERLLTLDDILADIAEFDETTTIEDILEYVNNKFDVDLSVIAEFAYGKYAEMMQDGEEQLPTFAELMQTPIFGLISSITGEEIDGEVLVTIINNYKAMTFADLMEMLNGEVKFEEEPEDEFEDQEFEEVEDEEFEGFEDEEFEELDMNSDDTIDSYDSEEEPSMFETMLPAIAQYLKMFDITKFEISATANMDANGNLTNITLGVEVSISIPASEETEEAQSTAFDLAATISLDLANVGTTTINTSIIDNWNE